VNDDRQDRGEAASEAPTAVASPAASTEDVDLTRRRLNAWLWRVPVLLAAGGVAAGGFGAYRVHFSKRAPAAVPTFEPLPPTTVAPLARFDAPWDAVDVVVGPVPSIVLRVPDPVAGGLTTGPAEAPVHLVGFSRVCTHLHCIVDLNTDLELIAFAFNHRTTSPALTCSCHFSVFDPLRAGFVASGPAVRPLPRLRLHVEGTGTDVIVVADGVEPAA
jgi:arsenite oxidase small subunit